MRLVYLRFSHSSETKRPRNRGLFAADVAGVGFGCPVFFVAYRPHVDHFTGTGKMVHHIGDAGDMVRFLHPLTISAIPC